MSKVIAFSADRNRSGKQSDSYYDNPDISDARKIVINRMCSSLLTLDNQRRFRAFPEGYCREYGLTLAQIHAVTDLDVLRLLKLGVTIPNLEILIRTYGLNILELCCEQTGKSPEEVRVLLAIT